jgi:glycosyltransferase involved in cell wall biosynthesis
MGEAARQVVAERFNADHVARKYLEIYADLLAPTLPLE